MSSEKLGSVKVNGDSELKSAIELGPVIDKRTRFQVNKVSSSASDSEFKNKYRTLETHAVNLASPEDNDNEEDYDEDDSFKSNMETIPLATNPSNGESATPYDTKYGKSFR